MNNQPFTDSSPRPIRAKVVLALDADGTHAVVIRSALSRGRPVHRLVWEAELPLSPESRRALDAVIAAACQDNSLLAGCFPASESVCRRLQTPLASPRKARQALPSLLDVQLPFPLEQCLYAFLDLHAEGGAIGALAIAARREAIEQQMASLQALGFDPALLLHEGTALFQEMLRRCPPAPDEQRVIAYLGHRHAVLLHAHGPRLQSVHALATEGPAPDRRLGRLAASFPLLRRDRPLRWIWCGPGAAQPTPLQAAQEALSTHENISFDTLENSALLLPEALAAAALLPSGITHNFRAGPLAHPRLAAQAARSRRTACLLTALLGCFLAAAAGLHLFLNARIEHTLDTQISALLNRIMPGANARGHECEYAENVLADLRPAARFFADSLHQPAERLLATLLNTARAHGILIHHLTLSPDAVSVRGSAPGWRAGEQIELLLQSEGYKTSLQRAENPGAENVAFTVQGERHDPP